MDNIRFRYGFGISGIGTEIVRFDHVSIDRVDFRYPVLMSNLHDLMENKSIVIPDENQAAVLEKRLWVKPVTRKQSDGYQKYKRGTNLTSDIIECIRSQHSTLRVVEPSLPLRWHIEYSKNGKPLEATLLNALLPVGIHEEEEGYSVYCGCKQADFENDFQEAQTAVLQIYLDFLQKQVAEIIELTAQK